MKCCATAARRDNLRRGALAFFALAVLAGHAVSQETTLRSRSNLVLTPALVKDSEGGTVYGLKADDFVIEDDSVAQAVRLDEAPEGQPISLVVAIQKGRRAPYEFPRMQGLKSMLSPLFASGASRVAVVEFDSEVKLIRDFTTNESAIDSVLTDLQPGDNGAAIVDAVNFSAGLLEKEADQRERVLLLISETRDHGSSAKMEDTVAAIGRCNATMYALAFSPALSNILDTGRGTNKNEMHNGADFLDLAYRAAQALRKNVPDTIAAMTGGEYELFATRKKFEVRMNDFTNHLHSRYLLSFAPQNPRPGLHRITVKLKNASGDTVLARTTYWAEGTQ